MPNLDWADTRARIENGWIDGGLSVQIQIKPAEEELFADPGIIDEEIDKINALSHKEMTRMWRFTKSGNPYFRGDLPFFDIFSVRFLKLGGFNSEISKEIGWER